MGFILLPIHKLVHGIPKELYFGFMCSQNIIRESLWLIEKKFLQTDFCAFFFRLMEPYVEPYVGLVCGVWYGLQPPL